MLANMSRIAALTVFIGVYFARSVDSPKKGKGHEGNRRGKWYLFALSMSDIQIVALGWTHFKIAVILTKAAHNDKKKGDLSFLGFSSFLRIRSRCGCLDYG